MNSIIWCFLIFQNKVKVELVPLNHMYWCSLGKFPETDIAGLRHLFNCYRKKISLWHIEEKPEFKDKRISRTYILFTLPFFSPNSPLFFHKLITSFTVNWCYIHVCTCIFICTYIIYTYICILHVTICTFYWYYWISFFLKENQIMLLCHHNTLKCSHKFIQLYQHLICLSNLYNPSCYMWFTDISRLWG